MLVSQLLKDIQTLIDRGTINSTAEISVQGELKIYDERSPLDDYWTAFESDTLEINIHESCYNKLILTIS